MPRKKPATHTPGSEPDGDINPFESLSVVERPLSTRGKWKTDKAITMLTDTLASGKAVRLSLKSGIPDYKIHMNLRHALKTRNLVLRYRRSGDAFIAWAEGMVKRLPKTGP